MSLFNMPADLPAFDGETMVRYVVTCTTPKGTFDLEIPTHQGPEAAARRAVVSLAAVGQGDLDDTTIDAVVVGTFETV